MARELSEAAPRVRVADHRDSGAEKKGDEEGELLEVQGRNDDEKL